MNLTSAVQGNNNIIAFNILDEVDAVVIPLEEAKAYMRNDYEIDDGLINETIIPSAIAQMERHLERTIVEKTYQLIIKDGGPQIRLVNGPVIEVESVTNDNDNEFSFRSFGDVIKLQCYLRGPLIITYRAGYLKDDSGDECKIPAPIKEGLLKLIATNYENRDQITDGSYTLMPNNVAKIVAPYKVMHW